MTEFLQPLYLWLKAFHIIAVIAWMAGMLYLPRLFVYHCETVPGTPEYDRFVLMERKLMRIIINPSMIAVWVLGLLLVETLQAWSSGWFHAKFALVLALSGMHGMFSRWRGSFCRGFPTDYRQPLLHRPRSTPPRGCGRAGQCGCYR